MPSFLYRRKPTHYGKPKAKKSQKPSCPRALSAPDVFGVLNRLEGRRSLTFDRGHVGANRGGGGRAAEEINTLIIGK